MLRRERAETDFPPTACELESKLILLEGAGDRRGHLGAMLYGFPVAGLDETTMERLKGALSNDIPGGVFIQVTLLSTPDIDDFVHAYRFARNPQAVDSLTSPQQELMVALLEDRRRMYLDGKDEPLIAASGARCHNTVALVSVKVPIRDLTPTEGEVKDVSSLVSKVTDSLQTFGLHLERADIGKYLETLRRILHMHEPVNAEYDENDRLSEQIMAPGDKLDVNQKYLRINDTYVGVLSVKRLPKTARLSMMNHFIGDPRGLGNQITEPFMMTMTLYYPDQVKKAANIRRKAGIINYQAYGPMLRWVPRLAYKKEGFDNLVRTMEEGAVLVEMNFTLAIFSRSQESLDKLLSATRTYYGSFGLEMAVDNYICWPIFFNTLPLFPSRESIFLTHRFHSMAVKHAVNFAPILSEWRGTSTPKGPGAALLLLSRRNQPVLLDFYDSNTNYNSVLFAQAGGGKSVATQQIIVDYLSKGAKVWVIDNGHSYLKLCRLFGGEYMNFNAESKTCLNPFTNVLDLDDELDELKALLAKMAGPNSVIDDFRLSHLEEAIKATWSKRGNDSTITMVADYLLSQTDQRVKDLGSMLFTYTRRGSYGSWFEGPNNLNFNSNLVVCELSELGGKKSLQQVVLLQLIHRIQYEMQKADRSGSTSPRLLIVDEAWEQLNDPGVARWLEASYRKFRKSNGACLIVTQSINDLYNSPSGMAIAENSAHMLILQQRAETIDAVKESGRLAIGDYGFHMMRTVHTVPGRYSEILIYTDQGWGVCRLVLDRFSQVLFSTKGAERSEVIGAIESGVPAVQAINEFIERHG